MKLLVATRNQGKLREFREILSPLGIEVVSLDDANAVGDAVEDADTFEGNAEKKALYFAKQSSLPTIADDSGLCVDALNGAPGVLSARFSGENAKDMENNALLLKKLEDVPEEKRSAHFACVLVCVRPDGRKLTAQGKSEGVILRENRGCNGFGYDPLFYVPDKGKTFAQMTGDEKHAISHRGRALKKMAAMLPEFLKEN